MRIFLSILLMIYGSCLHSQFHFFGDTLRKLTPTSPQGIVSQGIYSYISNISTNGQGSSVSTIIKVDTAGKTIWTSYPTNYIAPGIEPVNIRFSQFILGRDNNLYAWMNHGKLAKVRETNGSVDWMVPLQSLAGSPAGLVEYDAQTILFITSIVSTNKIRLIRYDKDKGQYLGYTDLHCPGQGVFGIHVNNGNIFLTSRDSCYKYTSFQNPVSEWKVKMCTGADRFYSINRLVQDGNNLFVFGNKESGYHNGIISCIDITGGSLKWFTKNGGSFDFYYGDHKIKNGFLYTAWQHLYVGGTYEKCFINKIDINTGVKSWESNYPFRTQSVYISKAEAMVSMDIDMNETLYLTGYGLPDNYTGVSWGFMKIRGNDGIVLKRSYIPGSDISSDYPSGFTTRLLGGRLYTTGLMPGFRVAGTSVDTSNLIPQNPTLYNSFIQFTSSVVAIKSVGENKKVVVKKIGKSLKVEMVDAFLRTIWEKTIGDTLDPYEGLNVISVDDSTNTIHITARKYANASNNHFYFSYVANPELFYVFTFDTSGNYVRHYTHTETSSIINPYSFFKDSLNRNWLTFQSGTSIGGFIYPYGHSESASGTWRPRPYQVLKPTVFFGYSKDTILLFSDPVNISRGATVRKTWYKYFGGSHSLYWFWPTLSIRWINSVERENSESFYVVAKDSSYKDLVFKYRFKDSTLLWAKKFDSSIVTLKGYELNGSFYAISTQGNSVFLRKFNGANGDIIWTKTIAAPAGHIFKLGDYEMSRKRQTITVAGHVIDTLIKDMSKLHIVSFDTTGNIIHSYTSEGFKAWQNKGMTISIGQDGQTLVGGQLADSIHGYAGFIYEVDASSLVTVPKPQLKDIPASVCSDTTQKQKTGRLINPVKAPYAISIVMDNSISIPFNWADSSFNYPVTNAGNHTIKVTYSYQTSSAVTDTSFLVKATPIGGDLPAQNSNVLTAPVNGESYQWYLNNNVIAGAINKTLTITQDGAYSYRYTVGGCQSPASHSLMAVFTSITDPTNNNAIITFFPNPTTGNVTIKNLNPSFQYAIKIIAHNGEQQTGLLKLTRGNVAEADLRMLQSGTYIIQLWNLTKNVLLGNQKLVLVK